ncbi:hypothetical protein BBAL3_1537 [Brevundimonas sp. BAL3]|nr:hypothetical protein BBAL3_1537 [Brevundimonas sp. BAL3]
MSLPTDDVVTASGFRSSLAMGGDLDEVAASLFLVGQPPTLC